MSNIGLILPTIIKQDESKKRRIHRNIHRSQLVVTESLIHPSERTIEPKEKTRKS